jgi:hypothetical protein
MIEEIMNKKPLLTFIMLFAAYLAVGLDNIYSQLNQNKMDLDALSRRLTKAGAPWVEGDQIPKK